VEVATLIAGLVIGLLGGVVVERYRNQRADFETRREAYIELLGLADRYWMAMWISKDADPEAIVALEKEFGDSRASVELIAPHAVAESVKAYEVAILSHDDNESERRMQMVAAMRRDVGPSDGLAGRRSDPPTGQYGL